MIFKVVLSCAGTTRRDAMLPAKRPRWWWLSCACRCFFESWWEGLRGGIYASLGNQCDGKSMPNKLWTGVSVIGDNLSHPRPRAGRLLCYLRPSLQVLDLGLSKGGRAVCGWCALFNAVSFARLVSAPHPTHTQSLEVPPPARARYTRSYARTRQQLQSVPRLVTPLQPF